MYMKNLLRNVQNELRYQLYSNIIVMIVIIIFMLSCLNIYSTRISVDSNYDRFLKTYSEYKKEGMDIEEALGKPYKILEISESENVIDNILRYDFDSVGNSIKSLHPSMSINHTLSYLSILFLPLIFGIYGSVIATYDIKNRTLKLRAILSDGKTNTLAKQLAMFIVILSIILVLLFCMYIVSGFIYRNISNIEEYKPFILNSLKLTTNNFIQIGYAVISSIIFANIGYLIGTITSSTLIPTIIIGAYMFIIPNLGVYDLKNLILTLGGRIFKFTGNFQIASPIAGVNYMHYTVWLFMILLITILPTFIYNMRSKYV